MNFHPDCITFSNILFLPAYVNLNAKRLAPLPLSPLSHASKTGLHCPLVGARRPRIDPLRPIPSARRSVSGPAAPPRRRVTRGVGKVPACQSVTLLLVARTVCVVARRAANAPCPYRCMGFRAGSGGYSRRDSCGRFRPSHHRAPIRCALPVHRWRRYGRRPQVACRMPDWQRQPVEPPRAI